MVQDPENLKAVREKLDTEGISAEQRHVLQIMEKTFNVNIIEDPKAAELKVEWHHLPRHAGQAASMQQPCRCGAQPDMPPAALLKTRMSRWLVRTMFRDRFL